MRFFSGSARLRLSWWQSTRAAVSSGASLRFAADLRREMGERAREHVFGRYSIERLIVDIDSLYRELLQPARAGEPVRTRTT